MKKRSSKPTEVASTRRPLLTVKQACERLSVGRYKLDDLFRSGKLTKVVLGSRTVRVDQDDLDRYIESARQHRQSIEKSVAAAFDPDSQFDLTNSPFL